MLQQVIVEAYNPDWVDHFKAIKASIEPSLLGLAIAIEHVGSTSVPGLAAKPIIDIDVVIADSSGLDSVIEKLATLGYEHRGNLGIEDREAFKKQQAIYRHNLYVCPEHSISLRNHLCLRDSLRKDAALKAEYTELKYRLAEKFPESIEDYIQGKTEFILRVLRTHGYDPDSLEAIRIANLAAPRRLK